MTDILVRPSPKKLSETTSILRVRPVRSLLLKNPDGFSLQTLLSGADPEISLFFGLVLNLLTTLARNFSPNPTQSLPNLPLIPTAAKDGPCS
ncbi:MAG: hypothetical protein RL215_1829, partial [Planctomycetota bacterium]